ncbi:MAG: IclR family transcriptional regulator [Gemmatimonadetes bacterium]|nr:IclR family transcriptional regulator [Gemmatimonadota bacterium]
MLSKDQSRTVGHALDVLEAFQSAGDLGVSETARRLRLPKTVIHRLFTTLERRQYVRKDARSRRYVLTLKLWQVGASAMTRADLPALARETLEGLVLQTGETAYLSVRDGQEVVWVAKVEGREPLRVYVEVGSRAPAHCTASGKVLLAFAPDVVRSRAAAAGLLKLTRRTLTDPRRLARELRCIRATQVSFNLGERRDDIGAVAAPVFDAGGQAVAAVGLSGPLTRFSRARCRALGAIVLGAARELSLRLNSEALPSPRRSRNHGA